MCTPLGVEFFLRAVGADTEPRSADADGVASAAWRAAYSTAAAESAATLVVAVGWPPGTALSRPPRTSSGDPLRLTGDGDPARTVTAESLPRKPRPVINAAAAASTQNASIGRAWFAFTVDSLPSCRAWGTPAHGRSLVHLKARGLVNACT